MAKPKGPKWDQIRLDNVDRREYKYISSHACHGNSTVTVRCPFCLVNVTAYIWSFRAIGKRCDCGAMIGSMGVAYHWKSRGVLSPIEARARFGNLMTSGPVTSYMEITDHEGTWAPQYDDSLNLTAYKLQDR